MNPRILVRAGKHPFTVLSAEETLSRGGYDVGAFGRNVGNYMFSEAVIRAVSVPNAEVVADGFLTERAPAGRRYVSMVNREFDRFVVPLANAFRPVFRPNLDQLTWVIERLDIPVTVIGVGTQLRLRGNQPMGDDLRRSILRFGRAVLRRTASIGVRGDITRELMLELGFSDSEIDVIGCPSLFSSSDPAPIVKSEDALSSESPIAVTLTPRVGKMSAILNHNDRQYLRMTYIPQVWSDLLLMLRGEDNRPDKPADAPVHPEHRLYREGRMAFFLDASTWTRFLADQVFTFGTRMHGSIASLVAGTPALLLVHDSRTRELADYHELPNRAIATVASDVDARDLYAEAEFSGFNGARAERFQRYLRFLERNDIDHVFAHQGAEAEWNRELAEVRFPPPVRPLKSIEDSPLLSHEAAADNRELVTSPSYLDGFLRSRIRRGLGR